MMIGPLREVVVVKTHEPQPAVERDLDRLGEAADRISTAAQVATDPSITTPSRPDRVAEPLLIRSRKRSARSASPPAPVMMSAWSAALRAADLVSLKPMSPEEATEASFQKMAYASQYFDALGCLHGIRRSGWTPSRQFELVRYSRTNHSSGRTLNKPVKGESPDPCCPRTGYSAPQLVSAHGVGSSADQKDDPAAVANITTTDLGPTS